MGVKMNNNRLVKVTVGENSTHITEDECMASVEAVGVGILRYNFRNKFKHCMIVITNVKGDE